MYQSTGNDAKRPENTFSRRAYTRQDLGNLDMTCWHFYDFCNFWLEKTQTSHQQISGILHTINGRIGLFELWRYVEIITIRCRENWHQTWHQSTILKFFSETGNDAKRLENTFSWCAYSRPDLGNLDDLLTFWRFLQYLTRKNANFPSTDFWYFSHN